MNFNTDIVIGLEVHAELNTATKLFCSCPRTGSDEPNTRTCPVCLGHPGSKPVLNKKSVDYAIKIALATESQMAQQLIFSRKSYFYPDMSKNFQISQYEIPLATEGKIKLSTGKEIGLTRIHMEEDPAAMLHPSGMAKSSFVLVDYNRSGNPLVEIVTKPELTSAGEARDFMKQLISILKYLGIYDVDTCVIKADANISIKQTDYTRVEIKNITGFKEIERALMYEIARQKKDGAVQETRAWDADKGITRSMRLKETEADYGYIFEPDLVVTDLNDDWIESIRTELPELAHEKTQRFIKDYGIDETNAGILSAQIELAELYEKVAKEIDANLAAKWLRRELARVMNYNEIDFTDLQIDENHLIELLDLVHKNEITENVAKKILEKLITEPFNVKDYVDKEGLKTVSDAGTLEKVAEEAISENPKAVEQYKSGEEKALNFLMGKVMQKTKGTAAPKEVREILITLIKKI